MPTVPFVLLLALAVDKVMSALPLVGTKSMTPDLFQRDTAVFQTDL